ncbi:MAG: T9SS type A sorting domain-containing protein, partial [Bacteroidetes bacterium]|nr:T9SS type A sorting domain-containing protein [Bacteroidota bacterium]
GEPAKNKVVTGLKEKIGSTNNDIRLFPNPASGVLTVEFGRSHYFTSIEIIDGSGRILQTSPLESTAGRKNIDISMLTSGSYICRLREQSDVVSRPFVIQRRELADKMNKKT